MGFCTGWLRVNVLIVLLSVSFSAFVPSVLWRCWLGGRKGIRPLKKLSRGVLAWLSVWSKVQTCIWPSWCHCHSRSLASVKSRLILPFWCRLTWVVPDKGPLNGCVCVCLCSAIYVHRKHGTACHHTTLLQQLIDISHLPGPQQQTCCILLQIDFTFLVPVYPGCPGKEAIKRV